MQVRSSPQILIVDGVDDSRRELCEAMEPASVQLKEAGSVAEALAAVNEIDPDLMLAEVRLPDASGFSLCRQLRETERHHDLPVILVSHWSAEMDRVIAFESGADDFLARPFFGRELSSRVAALLRRRKERDAREEAAETPAPASAGYRPVRLGGRTLDLTAKEAAILSHLAASDGAVRSRRQLIEALWDDQQAPSERCIDSHVKSLRRKLGDAATSVRTVRGIGYRYAPHPELELD